MAHSGMGSDGSPATGDSGMGRAGDQGQPIRVVESIVPLDAWCLISGPVWAMSAVRQSEEEVKGAIFTTTVTGVCGGGFPVEVTVQWPGTDLATISVQVMGKGRLAGQEKGGDTG